ncbi:hypothetical protein RB195_009912 [Necator americanus]|uniref:Cytochrome c oxidase subunit n=1 Tax=Necator americanus TaxID=51031 RepID=A0ABR1CWP0_NECAM
MLRLLPRVIISESRRNSSGSFYAGRDFDNYKKGFLTSLRSSHNSKETWKKIFYVASIPCLAITMYGAYKEHSHHKAQERPEYVEYPFMNVRNKPFPWGDGNHSLFHNPREQYVPGVGFEKERHEKD